MTTTPQVTPEPEPDDEHRVYTLGLAMIPRLVYFSNLTERALRARLFEEQFMQGAHYKSARADFDAGFKSLQSLPNKGAFFGTPRYFIIKMLPTPDELSKSESSNGAREPGGSSASFVPA